MKLQNRQSKRKNELLILSLDWWNVMEWWTINPKL